MTLTLETIWTTFNTPLKYFILKRVQDEPTADDLLQEVYLKIHTHIHTLQDADRVEGWLYQVARNTIIDHFRTQRPADELLETLAVDEEEYDDLKEQLEESVRSMMECLSDEYRQALILTEYDGLTQKELSERLNISLSGAKSRVQRARQQLKDLLMNCCHFHFDRYGEIVDMHGLCCCCDYGGCTLP